MIPFDHHPVYAAAVRKRDELLRRLEDCRWELDRYEAFLALYEQLHEPERREAEGGPEPEAEAELEQDGPRTTPAPETAATNSLAPKEAAE